MKHLLILLTGLLWVACGSQPSSAPEVSPLDSIAASIARTSFPERQISLPQPPAQGALPLLQAAVDSCSLLGGGRVVVPAGVWFLDGALRLKSNVDLHLSEGCVLQFSGRADDFLPTVLTRFEGTELFGRSPMIYAYHQYNIAITGSGTIDAQAGVEMGKWGWDAAAHSGVQLHGSPGELPERPYVNRLRQMGRDVVPVQQREFGQGTLLRPTCIEPLGCSRVLIEGITIKDSPFWTIHPLYCSDVIVRGVTIDSYFPNNDGCDPESSSNVLIEDCLFRCGDDAVAIKSGRDADGRWVGRPSQNIVIRRCDFQSQCNGLCIGSEMSGGVQGIWMDSIRIGTVKNALYFKSNADRGGFIRDVHVSRVTIQKAHGALLRFETNYFGYSGGHYPAVYEDFDIHDVEAEEADGYAFYYDGNADCPMRRIRVADFHVGRAPHAYYLYHTEQCTFNRVTVGGEAVPEVPEQSTERQTCDVW